MQPPRSLEWWAGIECTVARLGPRWRNQLTDMDLALDASQLRAIRALGVRRLRFPVLWETIAPDAPEQCDWRWHDERLG